jgi:hypothetical protein
MNTTTISLDHAIVIFGVKQEVKRPLNSFDTLAITETVTDKIIPLDGNEILMIGLIVMALVSSPFLLSILFEDWIQHLKHLPYGFIMWPVYHYWHVTQHLKF